MTAPAWHDKPTEAGLWIASRSDNHQNPWTCVVVRDVTTFQGMKDVVYAGPYQLPPTPERIEEIEFNGQMIPAPLRVAPAPRKIVYVADPEMGDFVRPILWENTPLDRQRLERGLLYLTVEAAARHGKAMCVEQP